MIWWREMAGVSWYWNIWEVSNSYYTVSLLSSYVICVFYYCIELSTYPYLWQLMYTDRNIIISVQQQHKIRKINSMGLLLGRPNPALSMSMMSDPMHVDSKPSIFMDTIKSDRSLTFTSSTSSESSSDSIQTLYHPQLKASRRGRYKCSRCGVLKVSYYELLLRYNYT